MIIRDKYGWPVVRFKNKTFTNFIRYLLWGNILQTWKRRKEVN